MTEFDEVTAHVSQVLHTGTDAMNVPTTGLAAVRRRGATRRRQRRAGLAATCAVALAGGGALTVQQLSATPERSTRPAEMPPTDNEATTTPSVGTISSATPTPGATGQPVNLSIRQGDEIVYIERAVSERSGMQVVRAVGGRAPLHLTSVGKLFLTADEARNVRAYATRTGLAGHTRNSITDIVRLERELALVRARGYARDNEELELGVRCIAAGIRDDAGRLVAGLSISAPADFVQDDWIDQLCRTAGQISSALGYEPVET